MKKYEKLLVMAVSSFIGTMLIVSILLNVSCIASAITSAIQYRNVPTLEEYKNEEIRSFFKDSSLSYTDKELNEALHFSEEELKRVNEYTLLDESGCCLYYPRVVKMTGWAGSKVNEKKLVLLYLREDGYISTSPKLSDSGMRISLHIPEVIAKNQSVKLSKQTPFGGFVAINNAIVVYRWGEVLDRFPIKSDSEVYIVNSPNKLEGETLYVLSPVGSLTLYSFEYKSSFFYPPWIEEITPNNGASFTRVIESANNKLLAIDSTGEVYELPNDNDIVFGTLQPLSNK